MNRIQVIAKNVNFPSTAAPPPAPAAAPALCDKAVCRALRWELKSMHLTRKCTFASFKIWSPILKINSGQNIMIITNIF